jgi:hypothetical protein
VLDAEAEPLILLYVCATVIKLEKNDVPAVHDKSFEMVIGPVNLYPSLPLVTEEVPLVV